MFVGFTVFTLVFGMLSGMGILTCLAVPIFVVSVKLCYTLYMLNNSKKELKAINENKPSVMLWTEVAILEKYFS